MYALETKSLTKRYGGLNVIDALSVAIQPGAFLVVRGPSGCGKTTLLRCLALLERIDEGSILHHGKAVLSAKQSPRPREAFANGVILVFQELYLWPHLSVLHNVMLPLLRHGLHVNEARKEAMTALTSTGLAEKQTVHPITLSGGQRQRLALARVLALKPRVLLLDEITANLDAETARGIVSLIEALHSEGTTIVMVTHAASFTGDHLELTFTNGEWVQRSRSGSGGAAEAEMLR
jgi:polar amino acid transport system ATP-binding protein